MGYDYIRKQGGELSPNPDFRELSARSQKTDAGEPMPNTVALDAEPENPKPGDVWIDLRPDPAAESEAAAPNPVDERWNLLPEGAQRGLAADALGTPYQGQSTVLTSALLDVGGRTAPDTYFEVATQSSAGDEQVTAHLYDVTAAADVGTVAVTGGSSRARSGDLGGNFAAGNELRVDWEVTTASATSGATFDAVMARIVMEY